MVGYDDVGWCLVAVAFAILLVVLLVRRRLQDKPGLPVWLVSGVVGTLLGSAVPYTVMRLEGYELAKSALRPSEASVAALEPERPGMGGLGLPLPKIDLMTLVEKLDLLTSDIGITLSAEQAAKVIDCLKDIESIGNMSHDDATAKHKVLLAILNEDQKARLEAIGLPKPITCGGLGMGPGMQHLMGGTEAPKRAENQPPPRQNAPSRAVKSLRERFAPKGTAPTAETPKAPPAETQTPKAPPPKADAPKSPAAKS
jgi:hypothetical protein